MRALWSGLHTSCEESPPPLPLEEWCRASMDDTSCMQEEEERKANGDDCLPRDVIHPTAAAHVGVSVLGLYLTRSKVVC